MIASFVARTAAVTMTVYITSRAGVWGQIEDSDRLYRQVTDGLQPLGGLVRGFLHFPEPESEISMGQLAREVYNQGVKDSFHILQNLPDYSSQLAIAAKVAYLDLAEKAKELSRNMDTETLLKKEVAPPKEDKRGSQGSTIVIVSPETPLEEFEEDTRSTDLAVKKEVKSGSM